MDDARLREFGAIAARRLSDGMRELISDAAASSVVDERLIAAVIALEMRERGSFARRAEAIAARLLPLFGATERVERMSLGIAQIQPRRLSTREPSSKRVAQLLSTTSAITACLHLVEEQTRGTGLDASAPSAWSRIEWERFGRIYNGTPAYGSALASAFSTLAPSPR